MRIAVIGSGIAGLGAAWLLSREHGVDVYEADDRLGGHAHTTDIEVDGLKFPVDTGFMVFNHRTYPNLVGFFEQLGVTEQSAEMSFSVTCADANVEWAGSGLSALFAERGNLVNPGFWRMLWDILRLDRTAHRLLARDEELVDVTLGELLDRERYGRSFRQWYLVPMASAVWSTPPERMLEFPAASFLRFAHNHGLLYVMGKPRWQSVLGGSREYVRRAIAQVSGTVRAGAPVERVRRGPDGATLTMRDGTELTYDAVIIASHADQTLRMLEDPSDAEREVLGSFPYQPNVAALHTDARFLPTHRAAWSAWNYFATRCGGDAGGLSVTYWLSVLQRLPAATPVLCTINPAVEPDPASVIVRYNYEHPMFDRTALRAQGRVASLQGDRSTWYAGAWQRYGFHEDGLWSAVRVAEGLGVRPPWRELPDPDAEPASEPIPESTLAATAEASS